MSLRRSSRVQASSSAIDKDAAPQAPSKKRSRKMNVISESIAKQDSLAMPPPTTPVKRRRIASKAPPSTPTPSAIGVMLDQSRPQRTYSSGDIDDSTPPETRPVEPHHTNATLVTPGGTQLPSRQDMSASPSRPSLLNTSTLLADACSHLVTIDPKLKPLVDRHHCRVFSAAGLAEEIDPFRSLVSGILSQQVSGAAAKSIKNKFIALYQPEQCPNGFPLPAAVAADEITRLRTAGLSQRKAEYVQGLAQKFASRELTVEMLMNGSDEEVMEKLVAVRGLGAWSVEMFMCFALKRTDVFSTGDLGVQRGMAAYVGRDVAKLKAKGGKWKYMSEQDMLSISEKFRPYRSLLMWYMWRIEDVDTDAVEGN